MMRRRTIGFALLHILVMSGSTAFAQEAVERKSAPSMEARLSAPARGAARTVASSRAASESDLQLKLSSRFVFAPGAIQSRVRVTPHRDNRLLRVTFDSPNLYRSSDIQLDGIDAAINHFQLWSSLPEGHYEVIVTVFGADGPRSQHQEPFDVYGSRR